MTTDTFYFLNKQGLAEDTVWRQDVAPLLHELAPNVHDIWHYAFTEMFNNAIDHSEGTLIWTIVRKQGGATRITIGDDGEGIFRRIKRVCRLNDEKHAILELSKGKLTTDPKNHSGEGIFFTSRAVDRFVILSRGLAFIHDDDVTEDWLVDAAKQNGTAVIMELRDNSPRVLVEVFDRFTSDDGDFGFDRTVIPVKLATDEGTKLISRSQAKRVLARIDRFKAVVLDMNGISQLGQGFADQVFRVFALEHPEISLGVINASEEVALMIRRAQLAAAKERDSSTNSTPPQRD